MCPQKKIEQSQLMSTAGLETAIEAQVRSLQNTTLAMLVSYNKLLQMLQKEGVLSSLDLHEMRALFAFVLLETVNPIMSIAGQPKISISTSEDSSPTLKQLTLPLE